MIYIFADCVLDTQCYTLCRAGWHTRLRPKVFQMLMYFLTHRDRVVSKQELCEQIWSAQFVSDAAIENCLKAVRQVIGDNGRTQRMIQTLYGHGYRFVAEVTASSATDDGDPTVVGLPLLLRAEVSTQEQTALLDMTSPLQRAVHLPHAGGASCGEWKVVTVLCCACTTATTPTEPRQPEASYHWPYALYDLVRSEMQRYGGCLQPVVGDYVVAIFGAPVAQDDHAQRAVLAALGIHRHLAERHRTIEALGEKAVEMGMGLHSGLAVVGENRTAPAGIAVVDKTVTQAVTLQEQAVGGTILCSETTARLVRRVVRLVAVQPLPATAQSALGKAYQILGRKARRVPAVLAVTPFVGRTRELAGLHAVWTQVEAGQGHVVGIVGEPGMGKSRLVHEFRRSLRGRPHAYVRGYCVSYGQAMPYQSVRALLQHACGITEADSPTAIAAKVQRCLHALDMDTRAAVSYLLLLMGRQEAPEQLAGLSPEEYQASMFATLLQMCLNGSRRRPLVIAVEDLHWIDASSEACLMALVERLAGVPLLLLVTYRPGYRPPWIDKSYATQVSLTRLSPDDSQRVVKAILSTRQSSETLVRQLVAKADGNPFFLEELAQSVMDQGLTQPTLVLPDTVQAVLAARIDRLPPTAKRVLQVAAVIGKDVSLALLQATCSLPKAALDQSLASLQAAEFLYETHLVPASVYTFRHVLSQEAVYHSLLEAPRRQLHQQIAQVLTAQFPETAAYQPELLAYHYTQAGLNEPAIVYWQRAGQGAAGRAVHAEAIAYFTQGLELLHGLPVTPERVRQALTLQCSLGVQLAAQGSATPQVERTYTRALELCQQVGDARELFPVLFGLSRFYKKRGKLQRAGELGEQFLNLVQDHYDSALCLYGYYALGDTLFWQGEFTAARAYLEKGIACYTPRQHHPHAFLYEPDPGLSCLGILSLTLWFLGYPDQALLRSQEALVLAQESSHPYSLARALANAAALHTLRREWQALQERAEALQTLAAAQGFAELSASATRSYGLALVEQGQVVEGIAQMQQSMAALHMLRIEDGQATHLAQLAKMYGRAGLSEKGLHLLAEAMAARQDAEERFDDVGRLRLKGELLLMLPYPDGRRAASYFRQALAIARQQQAKSLELRTVLCLSRLWQQQGQRDKARQLLAPIYGWFTEGFETADLREAKVLLEELGCR